MGGRAIQGADGVRVVDGEAEDADDVVDVNPAHPLRPLGRGELALAADRGTRTHLEDRGHDADIVQFLLPDVAQPDYYRTFIEPHSRTQTLMFSHGFNIHYELIRPPTACDVIMVAPKSPGRGVRELYCQGFGVPCLVAVHQDRSGRARNSPLLCDLPWSTRAGILQTTFREETETDLFGEQAVLCGGTTELVLAAFETLVQAGYQPDLAYFECLHELKLIVDLLYEGGLAQMHACVSDTAKYGHLTRGRRVIDESVRQRLREILGEIQNGSFAREWVAEVHNGMPRFKQLLSENLKHPMEAVGKKLRALMTKGHTT